MPGWRNILDECRTTGGGQDVVRRKYLAELYKKTGRNTIVYYSGWLQKNEIARQAAWSFSMNDADKNGFMAAIHGLDRAKGLDLLLHTPGGEVAATESIVDYLRSMFGTNIRAIVPQLAMSSGTMVSLACREVIMGKQSSLGPIDPQVGGVAAHGVLEEFARAFTEVDGMHHRALLWQSILSKYPPTLVGEAQKAITWSNEIVASWLQTGMFEGDSDADEKVQKVVSEMGDHALTRSHSRHLSAKKCREIGVKVVQLEDDDELQDLVLTVHHACIQTFATTPATKIIENHEGNAYIEHALVQVQSR